MFAQFLSQIAQDRRGSVAQIFALALIPVAFMAGAAIDYTRSVAERSELQVAVDAAVLAGAKDASQTWTTTSANVFKAAYKGTASAGFMKDAQGAYVGTASASVPTTFVGIAGIQQIPIGVSGKAAGGNQADTSCILTLGTGQPVADATLTFNGAPNVALSGCTIRSNTSLEVQRPQHRRAGLDRRRHGHRLQQPAIGRRGRAGHLRRARRQHHEAMQRLAGGDLGSGHGAAVAQGRHPDEADAHRASCLRRSHAVGQRRTSTGGGADAVIVIENGRLILAGNASIQTSRVAFVLTGDNTKASAIEFPNGKGTPRA